MLFYQNGQRIVRRYVLLLFLGVVPAFSENADYWIIKDPSVLNIYNQYEQRLNNADKRAFGRFSAWQILSREQLLSDQFTRVLRASYDQHIYYLQLNDQGKLINYQQAAPVQIIKNARVFGDTIRVKKGGRLQIENGTDRHQLPEGALLQRLFLQGRKTFVRELDGSFSGWLSKAGRTDFEIFHIDKGAAAYREKLFGQVNRIIQSYNQRLSKLFTNLNQRYDKSLPPPKWEKEASAPVLTYTLYPASYQTHFMLTRNYLIQELKDLLHGSDYTLAEDEGSITIKKTSP